MADRQLEQRLREAIVWAEHKGTVVELTVNDAKRLLYRVKIENSKGNELVYRKDTR